jgi:hypothetical protein
MRFEAALDALVEKCGLRLRWQDLSREALEPLSEAARV